MLFPPTPVICDFQPNWTHKVWGLRRTEANALRRLMLQRNALQNGPLWVYDVAGRTWLLNLAYTRRGAMTYLRTLPVTRPEWRQAWELARRQWSTQHLSGE